MANLNKYREYQRLDDEEEDSMPAGEDDMLVHVPEGLKDSWHHINNLDNFFTRIYHFHQKNGFSCMMLSEFFELVQFLFVVIFTTFLFMCVDYDVLFANTFVNHTHFGSIERNKVTLPDAILPQDQCYQRIQKNGWIIFQLVMAAIFWLYRLVKVICNMLNYWEIRTFYIKALKIPTVELCNFTWQEVQQRLISIQREHQMCVHKKELTELDIYHRILRFKNYMVAMVNKSLLPIRFHLPGWGEVVFLSQGLKYNFELILFWGPGSLFQNKWNLHPKYKRAGNRLELARHLSRTICLIGLANLLLSPLILIWQILYAFFSYAEIIKREPGSLGARRWSLFGRLYLRHFNELEHELQMRLNRGYKPASKYMNSFISPLLTVVAKNIAFFSGSVLAVLITLAVYDEDVLTVQHILTAITILGIVVTISRSFIPDEHMVWNPEQLLQCVLAHIHYMPDHWKGNANASETRNELAELFQYKAVFILEELLSSVITPLILIFCLRHKSLEIIDFFRNFSVEVVGVGDICSFAQLDVRKHGNPQWFSEGQTEASIYQQAENGKTELSLMHFAITNPQWQPPQESSIFIGHLKEKVQQDATNAPSAQLILSETPLAASLLSNASSAAPDDLLSSVLVHPILTASGLPSRDRHFVQPTSTATVAASILASFSTSQIPSRTQSHAAYSNRCPENVAYRSERTILEDRLAGPKSLFSYDPNTSVSSSDTRFQNASHSALLSEYANTEMSLHAIYMHEKHQQQSQLPRAVGMWQCPSALREHHVQPGASFSADQPPESLSGPSQLPLGGWAESEEEQEQSTRKPPVPRQREA